MNGSMPPLGEQTITPGTTEKTIAAGRYLSGLQTIARDANLLAANIKKGVSIFGVNGSFEGGGGNGIVKRTSGKSIGLRILRGVHHITCRDIIRFPAIRCFLDS